MLRLIRIYGNLFAPCRRTGCGSGIPFRSGRRFTVRSCNTSAAAVGLAVSVPDLMGAPCGVSRKREPFTSSGNSTSARRCPPLEIGRCLFSKTLIEG